MIIPKGTVVTIDGKVYRTLEAQVAWNKEELESLDIKSLEALPDQFTELQQNVSALSDSVADVNEDVGGLKSDMTDAQSDISGLKNRMTSAETNIGSNAREISQLQFDLGQAQGDISGLGNSKLNKPTNTGDVGDVIVKTANGTEYQAVAPFNPNGTYPNVTAGKAISAKSLENVSEDSGATQTAPFFFQATASANNTEETPTSPVFELKSIRGNTIVYNQLVDGMTTTYPTISGHTYWAFHSGQPPVIVVSQGTPISFPSPQSDKLVDLTRWFNGSIPQAILDNPSVFPINYYDGELTYSAGELKNCSCTELVTTGLNQLNADYISGTYTAYANVFPSAGVSNLVATLKQLQKTHKTLYYDVNATNTATTVNIPVGSIRLNDRLNNEVITLKRGQTFSLENVDLDSVWGGAIYGGNPVITTTLSDPIINIHWDGARDGTYEPYTSHTYPMVYSGKSAGSAYDEKLPDGTEITRIGSVDLGSLNWAYSNVETPYFFAPITDKAIAQNDVICAKYVLASSVGDGDKVISSSNTVARIYIRDDDYTDAVAFKTAMSGVTLYYELETPTTSEGTPYTSEIEGDDYGTMAFDSVVPVGNEFFYPSDYSLLIDDLGNYTGYDVTKLAKKTDLIPAPTGDGTYTLKAVVSGGTVTYSWEAVS